MKKSIMLASAVVAAAFVVSPLASADEPAPNIPAIDRPAPNIPQADRPAPNIPHAVSGKPARARIACG
ncbi:hypothetical protein [Saccharopolyspora shandongensis]|uniref:hypothetical protein n=1 Tax=Saccharopolyspora shandongensis TaxID=418495 RepID=UPI0033E107BE